MGRYFDQQQDYIDRLQKDLDKGLEDQKFIKELFPLSDSRTTYDSGTPKFLVELKPYYSTWGEADDEHVARSKAREQLRMRGVLTAFPENGKEADDDQ